MRTKKAGADDIEALLHGCLREVNPHSLTAQLHRLGAQHVQVSFDESLSDDILRLAKQYIEVRGHGRIDERDRWETVQVDEISATRSWRKPFDKDAFLNDPNPNTFDPEKVVIASKPFDVDELVRVIQEGRDT